MSAEKTQLELDKGEREKLIEFFKIQDLETLKASAQAITMLVRAFQGLEPEPSDIISKLIDVKNPMERSRFPTYPILQKQVYLRLLAALIPEAESCLTWADLEAHALVEYKGEGRTEWVEATKVTAGVGETQQITIGGLPQAQTDKHGILRRGRNLDKKEKERREFEE